MIGFAAAQAQSASPASIDLPAKVVALSDLSAFRAPSPSWKIVGGAATQSEGSAAFATSPGVGVLVHLPSNARSAVETAWDHGDIDVSFEVMTAQGSSAEVLLMGRYAVQLSESWKSGAPTVSTIGAIAPRWDAARAAGNGAFEGIPPRQNAGRAPGLWQSVEIIFRAPRFADGRKTTNARFMRVSVNGVVVQENVQVTAPTQGAALHDEGAAGPLALVDEHGGLAIRNIRYKSYAGTAQLTSLKYRVYEGDGMSASYAASHAPTREGTTITIPADVALPQDKFAVSYDGTFTAPTAGAYRFALTLPWIGNDSASRGPAIGGGVLRVDDRPVVTNEGAERRSTGDVDLSAGPHPFAVTFYKNRAGFNRRDVSISVEGPGVERRLLSEDVSAFGGGTPTDPIMVEPQTEPVVLRSFVRHRNTKRVHVASVADPRGVHYSYDLAQGTLLYVWRGPFLETTQMWHERGEDQTAEPVGSTLTLTGTPSVARLANAQAAWPDSLDERTLRRDGYRLDKTGRPTFLYRVGNTAVEDVLRADLDGLSLHRELHLHDTTSGSTGDLFVQLAQADHITRQRDGSYVVGDRGYYITLPTSREKPMLRHVNGKDELIMPVRFQRGDALVAYNIVW